MYKIIYFLAAILLCSTNFSIAQGKNQNNQSKKNTSPKKQYLFEEVWVWTYIDYDSNQKDFEAYRESKTGSWLLPKTSLNEAGEMIEFIICHPDGTYYIAWQNAEFQTQNTIQKQNIAFDKQTQIPDYLKKSSVTKSYGDPNLGYHKILGTSYKMQYEMMNGESTLFLAKENANFHPLYYFNQLDLEAKIPIYFPLDLPADILVLEEENTSSNNNFKYKFKYISSTEYHVDLKNYIIK